MFKVLDYLPKVHETYKYSTHIFESSVDPNHIYHMTLLLFSG